MEVKQIAPVGTAAAPKPWKPEFSWIVDDLAVGGSFPSGVAEQLARQCGIGAVIDVRIEDSDHAEELASHCVAFLRLPTEDVCAVSQEMLDEGVRFAAEVTSAGNRLLIHCQHGIGRSALVALCVLVERGHPPMAALRIAKDAREQISPSPAQFAAWIEWMRRRASHHLLPSFEEFGMVAYRHLQAKS
jgi:hypothetical protein